MSTNQPKKIIRYQADDGLEYQTTALAKAASAKHHQRKAILSFFEAHLGILDNAQWKTIDLAVEAIAADPKALVKAMNTITGARPKPKQKPNGTAP